VAVGEPQQEALEMRKLMQQDASKSNHQPRSHRQPREDGRAVASVTSYLATDGAAITGLIAVE
jgi:hypothetical protein